MSSPRSASSANSSASDSGSSRLASSSGGVESPSRGGDLWTRVPRFSVIIKLAFGIESLCRRTNGSGGGLYRQLTAGEPDALCCLVNRRIYANRNNGIKEWIANEPTGLGPV